MGKSNKFDYTNRPNSSAKLGQIIGHALEKEIDKLQKDAEKSSAKSRKSAAGGEGQSSGKDTLSHVLDVKAPGKQLGDEGTCALANGLESALQKGNDSARLVLESLNLSDNGITTASLVRLAPIIDLASQDLKTIDLSNNHISVVTAEEAWQWERFLTPFAGCSQLQRLDLSGNPSLGAKALEIFFRVHRLEVPNLVVPDDDDAHLSAIDAACVDDDEDDDDDADKNSPTSSIRTRSDRGGNPKSAASTGHPQRRLGLRTVPCICLRDIGLTDAGALWLSYMVEIHHHASQMDQELGAMLPDIIKPHQHDVGPRGLDWNDQESTLGKDGFHLLKQTEILRRKVASASGSESADAAMSTHHRTPERRSRLVDNQSADCTPTRAIHGNRKTNVRSIRSTDAAEHEAAEELESSRKKIQRNIIAQHGAASVDLWRAALKAVVAYRILIFSLPSYNHDSHGPFQATPRTGASMRASLENRPPTTPSKRRDSAARYFEQRPGDNSDGASRGTNRRAGPPAIIVVPQSDIDLCGSELAITDVTNTPRTPKTTAFKPHRKDGFSSGSDDLRSVTAKLEGFMLARSGADGNGGHASVDIYPTSRSSNSQQFIQWQKQHQQQQQQQQSRQRHETADNPEDGEVKEADSSNDTPAPRAAPHRAAPIPSRLPETVIERIADFTLSASERGALSAAQRAKAFAWARERSNFDVEREWHRMADSAQVWSLLESVGCLTYDK